MGYRRIEWIGHASIFQNPVVEYNLATGGFPPRALELLRIAARRRIYRPDRSNVLRELRRDSPAGLSKTYWFGPDEKQMERLQSGGRMSPSEVEAAYVQNVTDSDWAIIQADERLRIEFLDVTDLPSHGPAGTRKDGLLIPPSGQFETGHVEDLSSLLTLRRGL